MKKTILNYLIVAIFATSSVFTACNPDDDESGNTGEQLVKTITFTDGVNESGTWNFEYDDENRITTIYVDNYERIIWQFIYSGNDLAKLKHETLNFLDFSKNGNTITVNFSNGDLLTAIELNSDGYPIQTDDATTFQYLDGNVHRCNVQGGTNIIFEYDNKKSPFYYCKTPKWFPVFFLIYEGFNDTKHIAYYIKNNLTELNYSYFENGEEYIGNEEYAYQYDAYGFPTKMYMNEKLHATFTYF